MAKQSSIVTYGAPVMPNTPQLLYELYWFGRGGSEELSKQQHFINIAKIGYPWIYNNWHRWYEMTLDAWCEYEEVGATGCVHGETQMLNPITGKSDSIRSLHENQIAPVVMTMNGPEIACVPVKKEAAEMFEVSVADGTTFVSTGFHRVMMPDGSFRRVDELYRGLAVRTYDQSLPESISELVLSAHDEDARRCSEIVPDSQSGYHHGFRSDDEQLLTDQGIAPNAFPSRGDDRTRSHSFGQTGDPALVAEYNLYRDSGRHRAKSGYDRRRSSSGIHAQSQSHPGTFGHRLPLFQSQSRSPEATSLLLPSRSRTPDYGNIDWRVSLEPMVAQAHIMSIRSVGRECYYDLTVPKSHHYFAQGAVHHNCASAHKTFMFSVLALTEWLAAPNKTRVILSAPTVPALRGSLWARIKETYYGMQQAAKIRFPYNMVDSKNTLQFQKGDDENAVIAVAVDSGSIDKSIGRIQGKHPGRVVQIVDEAAQTQPAVFFARANLRTGTSFFRFAAIANAVDQFDAHGVFCEPKDGYNSISVESESWETKTGIALHYDGLKSPSIQDGIKYPKLFSQTDVDAFRRDYGENSKEWYMYCRGFWSPTGLQDTVMDGAMISAGGATTTAQWVSPPKKRAFMDPAFSVGGDRCIIRFAKFGQFLEGQTGMALWDRINIQLISSETNPINYQICDRVIKECTDRGIAPADFGMDVTGASGLADMIEQRWGGKIRRLSFGGAASDKPMSRRDTRPAKQVCANKVTELWYRVAKMVEEKLVREMDAATAREFCMRRIEIKGERKCVEPKDEMKGRTKGVSPDDADPVAGLADMFYSENGGESSASGASIDADWEKAAARFNMVETYA